MKSIFNIFKNLYKKAKSYSDTNLKTAKTYTNNAVSKKLSATDLKLASMTGTVNVGANGTNWATLTCPSGRRIIAPCGFYWYGDMNTSCVAYAYRLVNDTQIQFAIRNYASGQAKLTLDTMYLYVDVGGGNN